MDISIILPTYCERENIGALINAIEIALQPNSWKTELIVVDDNSPDGTAELVQTIPPKPNIAIHCYKRINERGLATAIKFGLLQAKGRVVVVMDTDFNHDPDLIPQMVELLKYYDIIIGSRFVMGGGMEERTRYYLSLLYNVFLRMILRMQIQDNLSGFFAARRELIISMDMDGIYSGYGEYFIRLLVTAWRAGYRMLEVPVFYILRRHGQSKSRFIAMLRDYTLCVLQIWWQNRFKKNA